MTEASAGASLRVILVGKTGLDAKLRLAPEFEVIRVRTAMEAIGELSALGESAGAAVIVGDEAGSLSVNDSVARDFAIGVRRISPLSKVYRVSAGETPVSRVYDGWVAPDWSGEKLRQTLAVRLGAPAEAPRTEAKPARPAEPTPAVKVEAAPKLETEPPAVVSRGEAIEFGDEELVRALAHGIDVRETAIRSLRRRLSDASVEFSPGKDRAEKAGEATVAWEGHVMGVLRASHTPGAVLTRAAGWLAAWIRVSDTQASLRAAAYTDPLTGAFNRRYFDRFLESALAQAREERRGVTILVFDLDDFKKYNDQYGHATGDEVLKETVKLLKSVVRPTDRVCRIGGDEFAVIFHEPEGPRESGSRHPPTIHAIAGRFQQQICRHKFPKLAQAPGPLTISGGLATYPWDGATAADLLARADELAIESKKQGKNVITIGK